MILTKNELATIEQKKPLNREEKRQKVITILRQGNGNLTVQELQKKLSKAGFEYSVVTVRSMCQKEKIDYYKRNSAAHRKKRGPGIVIGEV